MARAPVELRAPGIELRPVASPVDTFVDPGPSRLRELAESLSKIDKPLQQFISQRAEKQQEEDLIRGEAAFWDDNAEGLAEGVRSGKIPAQYSPAFVKGWKRAQGNVQGNKLTQEFSQAYDAWDGKNSEDPEAFDQFVSDFISQRVGTEDPDVLRGLLPHIRQIHQGGWAKHEEYRHKETYEGNLEAGVAGAAQDIDTGNNEGLATEEGTDYPTVFANIMTKREAFVSQGGRAADFDKTMTDAIALKVLQHRDPGLLAWFDQKVPGESYTYGDTPYGATVKQNTTEALEVVARRQVSDDATKQKAEDDAAKDAAHRQAVELLAADHNAALPDGLISEGMRVDPTFRVRIEDWRKSLSTGFTDPDKLQGVYQNILDGGGFKAIQDAASQGVFGRPEDLTAAYNFAKGFEDNEDVIKETLNGSNAKGILDALDVRTKGKNEMTLEPISGMSNEGLEAQFDFKRMVQEWLIKNPEASLVEREEAISKIGKLVLDRVTEGDGITTPGTYERPEELQEAIGTNPFSNGTGVVTQPPAAADEQAPEADPNDADERADFLNGLDEKQRQVLEEQAVRRGVPVDELVDEMLGGPTAAPRNPTGGAPTDEGMGANISPINYVPGQDPGDDPTANRGFTPQVASAFLDEALVASETTQGVQEFSLKGDPTAGRLAHLIGMKEARNNYNAVYGNANSKRDLSAFSIDGILSRQVAARRKGVKSTAIGKYQFIYKTLRGLKQELGLKGNEPFTPELQDRMFMKLLERRGYQQFKAGKLSKRQFALRLSQEWASLPNPNTGRSFYAGDGLNRAGTNTKAVYAAMGFGGEEPQSQSINVAAYANIPDVDEGGNAGQRSKFLEWNSDPVGNHEATLKTVDPTLANVVRRAQKIAGVKFVAASGKRSDELQKKAVEWGWSKTQDSDHEHGEAIDLWPLDEKGAVKFDPALQKQVVKAMKAAAKELGVELEYGAEFKTFKDMPHFAIKAKPQVVAEAGNLTRAQAQNRLNQLVYDRKLSKGLGVDTKGGGYAPNAEIDKLRKQLKSMQG